MKFAKIESLENRRLLTFIPFTPERDIPGSQPSGTTALDVAGDHSFLFATATPDRTLVVSRFSATGDPIGKPQTLAQNLDKFSLISVSADRDGDAVVGYLAGGSVYFRRIAKDGQVS